MTKGLLGAEKRAVKVHHLVKAPENSPESIRIRESWDATQPATVYTTPERLPDGTPCTAATVILRTKGCEWWWKSGCTFCGYFNDVRDDVTSEDLHAQWEFAKKRTNDFEDCQMVKVYTSGTFFEDKENPPDWQETVLTETYERGLHLIVEAQAHLCKEEKIQWVAEKHPGCTVAIGLEAYDDAVLRFNCNKGFNTKQWHRAVNILRENGLRVKSYLLFKPPFMSEGDAIRQTSEWIRSVAPLSDEISINPMNIQKRTIVDRIHRAREYRPPWLWSLVEMIKNVHDDVQPVSAENASEGCRIIVHPTAAGMVRGSRNCGECDREVAAAIERYSVSADIHDFDDIECECQNVWKNEIQLDNALPVPLGIGSNRRAPLNKILRAP
ncbi:MAG: TIGR01210 family radical SAM protein [Euryarchaeota archaeon]|nr:TIGR01210 family radical SAM protein [Euryarchaeota archaeon]